MRSAPLFDRGGPEPYRAPDSAYTRHRDGVLAETHRLASAKGRILAQPRQGPATNGELNAICFRYGARLHELQRAGFRIDMSPGAPGVYVYRLEGAGLAAPADGA